MSGTSQARQVGGITFPESMAVKDATLTLNGAGVRLSAGRDYSRYKPMLDDLWAALTFEVRVGDVFEFFLYAWEGHGICDEQKGAARVTGFSVQASAIWNLAGRKYDPEIGQGRATVTLIQLKPDPAKERSERRAGIF